MPATLLLFPIIPNNMLEVGQILSDRYQLKQKLGQNAGRQTWLASLTNTERVIVKLLAFGDQVQWEDLKLFEREADILKQLDHPQIPRYRDYFSVDDRLLWFGLVQDYIPGSSLKELITSGKKFSEAEVHKIAIEILEILIYLHELSPAVLHRDIKPSNLIFDLNQQIYLVDFGAVQNRATTQGATFTVIGTYGYAPMEQFGGKAVPASDLYALGATLIHLLTGTSPADLPQKQLRIQFSSSISLSPHFIRWIETLTAPDVQQRFSTARLALKALNNQLTLHTNPLTHQPYGSRIQLHTSFSQLEIDIPQRGLQISHRFLIFALILTYGLTIPYGILTFQPLVVIPWLLGLLPLSILMLSAFSGIHLFLNRDHFVIEWKLLGLRYRRIQGKTSAIGRVYIGNEAIAINNTLLVSIVLQAGLKEFKFGAVFPSLPELERDWLIQEIENWLYYENVFETRRDAE